TYDFSEEEFLELPTTSITTGTVWTPTSVFVGPLLIDVMQATGVSAGLLNIKTLDDNSVPIPWDDLLRYGVILAHSQDGQRLNNKRWGPLWTIYPRDLNWVELTGPIAESRFIWQINRIEAMG
ncbi:molybdopterin-dependent oxidoreductase, partial [Roseateles sp. GG27B]